MTTVGQNEMNLNFLLTAPEVCPDRNRNILYKRNIKFKTVTILLISRF